MQIFLEAIPTLGCGDNWILCGRDWKLPRQRITLNPNEMNLQLRFFYVDPQNTHAIWTLPNSGGNGIEPT